MQHLHRHHRAGSHSRSTTACDCSVAYAPAVLRRSTSQPHLRQSRCRQAQCCSVRRPVHRPRPAAGDGGKDAKEYRSNTPDVSIRKAGSSAELRAAAYLRAASFYTYPLDRSEFSARSHRRMKTNAEWEALEQKIAGTAHDWQGVRVICLVAVIDNVPGSELAAAVVADLDASCQLPAADGGAPPQLVIGTLDVNIGSRLPSEELMGMQPAEDPGRRRAYLSNVCVAHSARRQGVAVQLIQEAMRWAGEAGVAHLYVHVRTRNAAAQALYTQRCGFAVERRETESAGQALGRPPRVLLHRTLQ